MSARAHPGKQIDRRPGPTRYHLMTAHREVIRPV